MKLFLVTLALLALGNQVSSAGLSCTIDSTVKSGTNNVTFTLTPSPVDALNSAGLGDTKSPLAILNFLQSAANPVNSAFATLTSTLNSLVSGIPIIGKLLKVPSCRLSVISGLVFCDNVPSTILGPLCATMGAAISNVTGRISLPLIPVLSNTTLACEADQPWGLKTVRAAECWAANYNGQGVVVANIDSGVRGTHSELKGNMRATYNFYNPYNKSNTVPMDTNGHGSHTMATMVGKTLGVAPGATWIACVGCNGASCDDEQLLACAQFLMCPDLKAKNCTTFPNIINNSWGGGIGNTFFNNALALMKQIGILNFFASGNNGPMCSTIASPSDGNGTKLGFLAVGSSQCDEKLSSFSSTGPSQAADNMFARGIDFISPGTNVLSAWNTNDTATNTISGTSQSCPHAAGAAAVLLSKNMALTIDQVGDLLKRSAYQYANITQTQTCGGSSSNALYPNNAYGYGRVDAYAALQLV